MRECTHFLPPSQAFYLLISSFLLLLFFKFQPLINEKFECLEMLNITLTSCMLTTESRIVNIWPHLLHLCMILIFTVYVTTFLWSHWHISCRTSWHLKSINLSMYSLNRSRITWLLKGRVSPKCWGTQRSPDAWHLSYKAGRQKKPPPSPSGSWLRQGDTPRSPCPYPLPAGVLGNMKILATHHPSSLPSFSLPIAVFLYSSSLTLFFTLLLSEASPCQGRPQAGSQLGTQES